MIPNSLYMPLLEAISSVGADMTDDCQVFLNEEFSRFSGSESEFSTYVREHVQVWFSICSSPPEWIQNAEWQFDEGKPMCFVGQVSVPSSARLFHDDAVIYVFANAKGEVKTVLQIS